MKDRAIGCTIDEHGHGLQVAHGLLMGHIIKGVFYGQVRDAHVGGRHAQREAPPRAAAIRLVRLR